MPLTNSIASRRLPFPVVRLVRQREHRPRGGATAQQQTVLPILRLGAGNLRGVPRVDLLDPQHDLRDVQGAGAGVVPPQPGDLRLRHRRRLPLLPHLLLPLSRLREVTVRWSGVERRSWMLLTLSGGVYTS